MRRILQTTPLSCGSASRETARQAGFTLLEVIVVIVIMAMVASLVLVKQPWHSTGVNTDATVQALTGALRLARSRAIAEDRAVPVVTGARGFSVDGAAAWVLPSEVVLSPSQVIFLPDGGATGATILLFAGERRVAVEVNWLTGRVRSQELGPK
ncbi:MAG TPA: GspH/FimT family pseudopilin [Rhodopila sp.]|nr:GspH/FimT family pseudopilin [Rhodopila sp.]